MKPHHLKEKDILLYIIQSDELFSIQKGVVKNFFGAEMALL